MERIDPDTIAAALLEAAAWARVGLTDPTERLRLQSAQELAQSVVDRIEGRDVRPDPAQLALGL